MAAHPDERIEAQASHTAYYATLLDEQETAVTGPDQQKALQLIERELDNIRAAWKTAVNTGQIGCLNQMVRPLYHFFRKQGRPHEGFEQFGRAAGVLRDSGPPDLLARLLVYQGRLGEHISQDFEVSERLLREGLALAGRQSLAAEQALALDGLGLLALMRGDLARASGYLNDSLTLSRQASIPNPLNTTCSCSFLYSSYAM
jgi:tetratricopeptide (TPR) repeat protein